MTQGHIIPKGSSIAEREKKRARITLQNAQVKWNDLQLKRMLDQLVCVATSDAK